MVRHLGQSDDLSGIGGVGGFEQRVFINANPGLPILRELPVLRLNTCNLTQVMVPDELRYGSLARSVKHVGGQRCDKPTLRAKQTTQHGTRLGVEFAIVQVHNFRGQIPQTTVIKFTQYAGAS